MFLDHPVNDILNTMISLCLLAWLVHCLTLPARANPCEERREPR
jgi:hypothetical protein